MLAFFSDISHGKGRIQALLSLLNGSGDEITEETATSPEVVLSAQPEEEEDLTATSGMVRSPFSKLGKKDPESAKEFLKVLQQLGLRPPDEKETLRALSSDAFGAQIHANAFQIARFQEKFPSYSLEEAMQLARVPDAYVPWAAEFIQQDWYKRAFKMHEVCEAKNREIQLARAQSDTSSNKIFDF